MSQDRFTRKDHESTSGSREVCYERARQTGFSHSDAKKVAEKATREIHENANRRG